MDALFDSYKTWEKVRVSTILILNLGHSKRVRNINLACTYENIPLDRLGRRRVARVSLPAAVHWTLFRIQAQRRLCRAWAVFDAPFPWSWKPTACLVAVRCPTQAHGMCSLTFSPHSGRRCSQFRLAATEDRKRRNLPEYDWSCLGRVVDQPETPGGRKPAIARSLSTNVQLHWMRILSISYNIWEKGKNRNSVVSQIQT